MGKHPVTNFNPKTQGVVHAEQKNDCEFFLGNFDRSGIKRLQRIWSTLRVGETAYDDDGVPYPKTLLSHYLPFPVFVDRNEAVEKYNQLCFVGRPNVDKATPLETRAERNLSVAEETSWKDFRLQFLLTIFSGTISAGLVFLSIIAGVSANSISAGISLLVSLFLILAFHTVRSYIRIRRSATSKS